MKINRGRVWTFHKSHRIEAELPTYILLDFLAEVQTNNIPVDCIVSWLVGVLPLRGGAVREVCSRQGTLGNQWPVHYCICSYEEKRSAVNQQ